MVEQLAEQFVVPASYAQQRMWFLDQIEEGAGAYNVPTVRRLRGPLNVFALERALDAVVERHESLRTTFTVNDGVVHQVVSAPTSVTLDIADLSGERDPEARGAALAFEHASRRFALSSDRLIRALLIKLGPDDHILAITLHHIITDAWSMAVVSRELAACYDAFVDGRSPDLPELTFQYADYAAWQQQWLESGGLETQLDHWMRALDGAPALLELPTDRPRPAEQSFRGATLRRILPRELADAVRALGEGQGATLFMTLLAAFATMLSRYSRQDDVVVATPVANRGRVEFEQLTGLLVNTLALRVDVSDAPSFIELLRRVREIALDAFSNQDLPFEQLVGRLNPERTRSHAPVAQVMLVVQGASDKPVSFTGLEHERMEIDRGTAKFDIALFAGEQQDGLRVAIEYCTDLFEEATIVRMLDHFEALLGAVVADPECAVSEVDFLPAAERERILGEFGEAAPPVDGDRCVHELVAEQARRSPEEIAVSFGTATLTYAELDARANRLAWQLHALGVTRDTVVGICADRGVELVVAVLAALKAGAAYAPIDPAYPPERVAFILADSAADVLLTQQHLVPTLPVHSARIVCLDGEQEFGGPVDEHAPPQSGVTPDDLAYVLYTSGSTGRPKGVAMGHRALANLIGWQLESWTLPAPARTLQFASLSFDVAFQEIFPAWCAGGTVVLVDEDRRRDPAALVALLASERVERLFLPYVALQNLCEAAEELSETVPSLRDVITAGEQLKVTPQIRRFFARHPRCRLFNHYGPTESHVVTSFVLDGPAQHWPALPPIGRPIRGAVVRLLDRHLRPVPIGVPGELCIGGVSLARDYLGRPDLTAERFVPDPFSEEPRARLYRTGDLARHLPDGTIEFLGRIDHQVKIRGYRIEPGEVEAMLRESPSVREALVTTVDDERGQNRLVAYLISDEPTPTATQLRGLLERRLPEYMVPAAFVSLDAFPLSPNGKVDRRALPSPSGDDRAAAAFVPPRTAAERSLAGIWEDLLGHDRVGANDNFFLLGGHSLLAVRLFAEIERKLHVRLPMTVLFRSATLESLAAEIEGEQVNESGPSDWPSIALLRPGADNANPLFLIAWAGGEVLPYRDLVENLDDRRRVYGLLAPGLDRRRPPLASVQELAAFYVDEVRKVQPRGPYRLGGFCFSGLVAYEMARSLIDQGETIASLSLIDTYPFRHRRRPTRIEIERVKFRAFRKADTRGKLAWIWTRVVGVRKRAVGAVYVTRGPGIYDWVARHGWAHLIPRRPWNLVLVTSNLARSKYVPQPLDVRVDFFRAQKAAESRATPWEELARRGVVLHQVISPTINHAKMMQEPHARMLAEQLDAALQGADAALAVDDPVRLDM